MVDAADVDERIETIVADRLRVDADSFDDETPFAGEKLDAESLDVVEIAEAVDAEFGVYVPDEDLAAIDRIGELKRYVAERV